MLRNLLLALIGVSVVVMDDTSHALLAQAPYPHVVGPTGHPYGPTQAHYQYQRQYGRAWYGGPAPYDPNTGARANLQGGWNGYFPNIGAYGGFAPYGYAYAGVPGYGYQLGGYQYGNLQGPAVFPGLPYPGNIPTFAWQQPGALQQPLGQPQAGPVPGPAPAPGKMNIVEARPIGPPEAVQVRPHAFMPAQPSTVAARQRSLHLQGQGDIWFRQQNFLQAYSRYKQAAGAAGDLAAPHFRMAYALLALHRFDLAVPEFQRGIQLDPQYPLKGESLEQLFGEPNRLAAAALPQAVAAWVRQDIRSADRLFLLGALLTMSRDYARAQVLLQTAAEFGGSTEAVVAFLRLAQQPGVPAAPGAVPAEDRPPVPEAVENLLKEEQNWLPARPSVIPPPAAPTSPRIGAATKPSVEPATKPRGVASAKAVAKVPASLDAPRPGSPKKSHPVEPGYVLIPKKGSEAKPAEVPRPQPPEPEVVPASATEAAPSEPAATGAANETGPVIPIPNAGN